MCLHYDRGEPYGNPKTGSKVDVKISWGIKLLTADELVAYVGEDIEDFISAVEEWGQELRERNRRRIKMVGSRLVE